MNAHVKDLFIHELRTTQLPQIEEFEMVQIGETVGVDAYGLLAILYCAANPCFIGFVPMRGNPLAYFFQPRFFLLAWAELTDAELTALIEMNDAEGLSFAQIADVIEQEWR